MPNNRRAFKNSKFTTTLNKTPSAQDTANQGQHTFSLEDELAVFTNTQFVDFDLGRNTNPHLPPFQFNGQPGIVSATAVENRQGTDFNLDYPFTDFASFLETSTLPSNPISPQIPSSNPIYSPSSTSSPQSGLGSPRPGGKQSIDHTANGGYVHIFGDGSSQAIEEDKRRRNTAASARFRVKKKQREQAMAQSAKEMSDKIKELEDSVTRLKAENQWLKGLIIEKNENKEDVAELWEKFIERRRRAGSV